MYRKMEHPETELLPPPPSEIPPDVSPAKIEPEQKADFVKNSSKPKRVPMRRPGAGSKGRKTSFITNHFKVGISNTSGHFFHYCVSSFVCSCWWINFSHDYFVYSSSVLLVIGFSVL